MERSKTRWVIERVNRRGEAVHYLRNALYLDDNYAVTCYEMAHRFDTYDDAQRAVHRVEARGISARGLDIVPVHE